jgi:hypothetical protein
MGDEYWKGTASVLYLFSCDFFSFEKEEKVAQKEKLKKKRGPWTLP